MALGLQEQIAKWNYQRSLQLRDRRQSALSYALLVYMVILVCLITFIPFHFHIPQKIEIIWEHNLYDEITNIFLFLPLGFLFRLSRRNHKDALCLKALGFGILVSVIIETTQAFLVGRYTSVIDVITNGLGTWLGAIVFALINHSMKERHVSGVFALEIPLMNLVYLLIPLIWLNALSAGNEASRLWLLVSLGLFGSIVLSSIYIHRLKDMEGLSSNKITLLAMGWFLVASIPVLAHFPFQIIVSVLGIGIVVRLLTAFQKRITKEDRRFELPTLRKIFPLYFVYLLLLVFWPTTSAFGEWNINVAFQDLMQNEKIVFTFRFIESIGAFTLLGYMLAEMRGRKEDSRIKILLMIVTFTLSFLIAVALIKGPPSLSYQTLVEIILITGASIYGAMIYRLQLAAIQHPR
jgi:VanZ family protein